MESYRANVRPRLRSLKSLIPKRNSQRQPNVRARSTSNFSSFPTPQPHHDCVKMGFWKISYSSVFWASLFSTITYSPLVRAGNVVQLTVEWKAPPPSLVNNQVSRRLKARGYIQEGMYNNVSAQAFGSYMANVTVGTPGQQLSLVIENGSSDTIVLAANAYECTQKSWTIGNGPCFGGTC
jgi:hypothetical protein